MRKEDSAFVYAVLESYEGLMAYSTLPFPKGASWRDMVLMVPPQLEGDARAAVGRLGSLVEEIPDPETAGRS